MRLLGGYDLTSGRQFHATLSTSLGMLAEQEGEAGRARRLHEEALASAVDVVGFDHVRVTEATKTALGPEEFSRCYERGLGMTREQVVDFAG